MNIGVDPCDIRERFSGLAPIFPLPNVVTYPHVVLPLHIFEDRYRQMVTDVLQGDQLIAMALLQPGWEPHYESKTASIHEIVCLGQIIAHERLEDGRYNLALQGVSRALVLDEENETTPYRVGRLELRPDQIPSKPVINRQDRRNELLSGFREMFPAVDIDSLFFQLFDSEIPLGSVCDIIASAMQLEPKIAQLVLEEPDVDLRSDVILEQLRLLSHRQRPEPAIREFPPRFSHN